MNDLCEAAIAIRSTETDPFHLAIADWLESEGEIQEHLDAIYQRGPSADNAAMCAPNGYALKVAYAYMGWEGIGE